MADQIGSSRVIAEVPSGQTTATMCYDGDFEPYGGEHAYVNTCSQNYKFTGKERDSESNLDNFGARYYASTTGRFMSPDWALKPISVPYAKFGDPQTLNLHAYVENSPLNRIDADGHEDGASGPETPGGLDRRAGTSGSNVDMTHSLEGNAPGAQNSDTAGKAATVYGETSGLKPEVGKDHKADPNSAKELKDARENVADVSERNKTVYSHTPTSKELKNPQVREAWEKSKEAAAASDGSKPGKYFFIRQEGVGPQKPSAKAGFGQGDPIHEYGPFRNVGGGDVPKGNRTYVDIYNQ